MENDENLCEHCHEQTGDWCVNPYHQDMDGEEIWEFICPDCYDSLLGDI